LNQKNLEIGDNVAVIELLYSKLVDLGRGEGVKENENTMYKLTRMPLGMKYANAKSLPLQHLVAS